MAESEYKRGVGITPIQEMTTRQLRKYIRERADEANMRLSTIKDIEDTSQAFQDEYSFITGYGKRLGRGGAIRKDTSFMSKEEMVEYAYSLRDLNMLDTFSKYSKDVDYKANKERYQQFVRNQLQSPNPESRKYWSQYITEKGNVSKKGYQEYKNFINFIKNLDTVISTYGYEAIKEMYYDQTDQQKKDQVERLLVNTWQDNKGKGLTPSELVDRFYDSMEAEDKARIKKAESKKPSSTKAPAAKKKAPTVKKAKAPKSKQNIQIKTGVKQKNGRVREKQTTKKL